ncbi:MAG TPA: DMSO/selenate family reductase complex A subunit [Candidatus Baltobacteraceae bacterium]|nr:DMSO/selenate family reductase complex A subunit [Candidatus Baltobacteraceae bacterium]
MADEQTLQTACVHDCPGFCIINAHVKDGRIVRISTDTAPVRRQLRACARGRAYRQRVYHPDRLLHPLIRTGPRGEGQFRQATWDEALDRSAAAIAGVRAAHGNEALFVLHGTGHQGILRGNVFARRLLALLGGFLDTYGSYSTNCAQPASLATFGTLETGHSLEDLVHSKLLLLWGANWAVTFAGVGAPWYLKQAKEAGARVIAVDPRYTDTAAAFADEWVPIVPGTDAALMAAMASVMLEAGWQDQGFLDRCCVGFDEAHLPPGAPRGSSYRAYVRGEADGVPKTPAWAAPITGVPANRIVALARAYATTKPAALLMGWGPQRTATGEQTMRSAMVLAAMTGNIGIPGGSPAGVGFCGRHIRLASPAIENPIKAAIPIFCWTDAVARGTAFRPADGLRGTERLASDVKLILNFQGNLLLNQHSDINRTARLLRDPGKLAFILVADQFLTPSARFADVVFPAVTWMEREDVASGGHYAEHVLFLNQVIAPLGEARTDYWALAQLAERLGVGPAFTEGRDERGWLRHLLHQSGLDYDTLKREGSFRPEHSAPHVPFAAFRRDPDRFPLQTRSGKIEIYAHLAAAQGNAREIPAVPQYVESPEGASDPLRREYPLQLLTPHAPYRTHTIFANLPWIQEIAQEGISMHPDDAGARGIQDGEWVRVWNARGTVRIRARVTERIMPGVVAIPQGRWYQAAADGVDTGGCANTLTSARPTAWAKGNPQGTTLVQVARDAAAESVR